MVNITHGILLYHVIEHFKVYEVFFNKQKVYILIFFFFFMAAPKAYGGSQAKDRIGAVAAGLHHSHSNARSKLCMQLTSQLMATRDP